MSIRGAAFIAGIHEHPGRDLPHHTIWDIHTEVALGALADAGLSMGDVDALFCDGTAGFGVLTLCDHLGIRPRYVDSTETGGSSYLAHVGHAAAAIAAGKCQVALITLAAKGISSLQMWSSKSAAMSCTAAVSSFIPVNSAMRSPLKSWLK